MANKKRRKLRRCNFPYILTFKHFTITDFLITISITHSPFSICGEMKKETGRQYQQNHQTSFHFLDLIFLPSDLIFPCHGPADVRPFALLLVTLSIWPLVSCYHGIRRRIFRLPLGVKAAGTWNWPLTSRLTRILAAAECGVYVLPVWRTVFTLTPVPP